LNPARISKVNILDKENKILEVLVSEDQLSLAIGRRGQNVRLASKLLGWEIDIKSAEEKKREIEGRMESPQSDRGTPLFEMQSLSPEVIAKLNEAGITTIEKLVSISAENLNEILVLEDVDKAELLLGTVSAFLTMRQEAAKEPEESLEETEEKVTSPESDSDSDAEEELTETEEEADLDSADDETAEDQESQGNETEETRAQE